jgi:hypothetical protein
MDWRPLCDRRRGSLYRQKRHAVIDYQVNREEEHVRWRLRKTLNPESQVTRRHTKPQRKLLLAATDLGSAP